jgi:hypothetical protein
MMTKDTPIILALFENIGLGLLNYFHILNLSTAMIILLLGTIYLMWSIKE